MHDSAFFVFQRHFFFFREEPETKFSYSQPVQLIKDSESVDCPDYVNNLTVGMSFSQPVDPDNMILTTKFTASQMISKVFIYFFNHAFKEKIYILLRGLIKQIRFFPLSM